MHHHPQVCGGEGTISTCSRPARALYVITPVAPNTVYCASTSTPARVVTVQAAAQSAGAATVHAARATQPARPSPRGLARANGQRERLHRVDHHAGERSLQCEVAEAGVEANGAGAEQQSQRHPGTS